MLTLAQKDKSCIKSTLHAVCMQYTLYANPSVLHLVYNESTVTERGLMQFLQSQMSIRKFTFHYFVLCNMPFFPPPFPLSTLNCWITPCSVTIRTLLIFFHHSLYCAQLFSAIKEQNVFYWWNAIIT